MKKKYQKIKAKFHGNESKLTSLNFKKIQQDWFPNYSEVLLHAK